MEALLKTFTVICLFFAIIGMITTPYGLGTFIGAAFAGVLARYFAEKKNRDKNWGFVYGLTWGIFAIVYYLVCDKKEK